MRAYLLSLAIGLLVGVLYGALNVRSPAPPLVALMGLLGILLGERAVAGARAWIDPAPAQSEAEVGARAAPSP